MADDNQAQQARWEGVQYTNNNLATLCKYWYVDAMRVNAGEKVQVALLKSVIVSLENFLKNDILNVELLSLTGKSNIIGSVFIYIFIQN